MPAVIRRGARRAAPLSAVRGAAVWGAVVRGAVVRVAVLSAVAGVVATGLTACSAAQPTATKAQPQSASAPAATGTDARADAALTKAVATLATERSFRFDATQTVAPGGSSTPTTSSVVGSVVRDQGVAYTLTVGRTSTQVVRIKHATYVRKVPGRWAKLVKPRPVTDPTGSLLAVLHGLAGTARASAPASASATTVAGTLSTAAAKAAGIPTGADPAQVTATIDSAGHVTRVTVHTVTQTGTTPVAVTLVTSYTAFDRVPALRAPR